MFPHTSEIICEIFITEEPVLIVKMRIMNLTNGLNVVTARNEVGARLCFTRVCDSVHGGGSAPLYAGIHPPRDQEQAPHPPRTRGRTPPEQTPPGADTLPPGAATPSPGHPSPSGVHAGRYGQQAHPTGMQSCCVVLFTRNVYTWL